MRYEEITTQQEKALDRAITELLQHFETFTIIDSMARVLYARQDSYGISTAKQLDMLTESQEYGGVDVTLLNTERDYSEFDAMLQEARELLEKRKNPVKLRLVHNDKNNDD